MGDLISIVLPVYNGEKYLCESIDSVIAQTYENWELLILDDCSTDGTAQIAQKYVLQDSRIKYYLNEKNIRLPRNLNKGFSLAKGNYLTWTSDDNRYRPQALEKMIRALKEDSNVQFAFASCRIIDENGKEIEYIMVGADCSNKIVGCNPVGACFLYTRKVYEEIGDYNPEFTLVEDFDYWQRIFMKYSVCSIEEILYDYRWHSGALTSTMKKNQFNTNLQKMLLKNVSGFGKLNYLQKYYFYSGLSGCYKALNENNVAVEIKRSFYSFLYFVLHRVPNKLKRMIKK